MDCYSLCKRHSVAYNFNWDDICGFIQRVHVVALIFGLYDFSWIVLATITVFCLQNAPVILGSVPCVCSLLLILRAACLPYVKLHPVLFQLMLPRSSQKMWRIISKSLVIVIIMNVSKTRSITWKSYGSKLKNDVYDEDSVSHSSIVRCESNVMIFKSGQ